MKKTYAKKSVVRQSETRRIWLSVKTLASAVWIPIDLGDVATFGALSTLGCHKYIHWHSGMRSTREMKRSSGQISCARRVRDSAIVAMEQMELYCQAHPGSPSAVRRPRLFVRGDLWIALLGPTVEEGIVGIGPSVTAALRAFDAQYLAGLRPPAEVIENYRATGSASATA